MWADVVNNATVLVTFKSFFLDSLSTQLGLPKNLIRIIRIFVSSLGVEFEVIRNETYPISTAALVEKVNANAAYDLPLQFYTNLTHEVSVGLLEPVTFVQVVNTLPACDETCIGLSAGGSVLFVSLVFSLWYVWCYHRNAEVPRKKKHRWEKRPEVQQNEPLEDSADEVDDSDAEPFNETIVPQGGSKVCEPFDEADAFEDSDDERHASRDQHETVAGELDDSSPYGARDDTAGHRGSPHIKSNNGDTPAGREACSLPRRASQERYREPLFADDDGEQCRSNESASGSSTLSSSVVDIKPPAFEGDAPNEV
jgi:hypothetical protein